MPKALLQWGEGSAKQTLVGRAARAALQAGCWPVIAVVGARAGEVAADLAGLPVRLAANPGWRSGMGASIAAGARAVPPRCSGVVVMTVDQPGVKAALLEELIHNARSGDRLVIGCCDGRRQAPPTWFDAALLPELRALNGEAGARAILARHAARCGWLRAPAGSLADMDTPSDLRAEAALAAGQRPAGQWSVGPG